MSCHGWVSGTYGKVIFHLSTAISAPPNAIGARLIYRPQYMVDSGPRWEPLLWMASGANTSQFFVLRLYQLNPGPQRFLCVTMTRTKRKFGCPHRQEYPVSRLRHVAQLPP